MATVRVKGANRGNAEKKQQPADITPHWATMRRQFLLARHALPLPAMTSTQGWCHSGPRILFSHDWWRPRFTSNTARAGFVIQINSETHANFPPAVLGPVPLRDQLALSEETLAHTLKITGTKDVQPARKCQALVPLTPSIDPAGTKGLLMSLCECAVVCAVVRGPSN